MPVLPWPLPDRPDLRDRLVEAYSSGRGYHDVRHLTEVLARLDELGESGNVTLVLAAWFHDAVYDGSGDDEELSARLAEEELRDTGVDVAEVARLVRLTRTHDPAPDDANGAALCDADLAVLAAPPGRYQEYVAGVRCEHPTLSERAFREGRLAVIRGFASRDALFRTSYARHRWEPRARANLAHEIAELDS